MRQKKHCTTNKKTIGGQNYDDTNDENKQLDSCSV